MSRSNRQRGHLHAVPDVGPSATGSGAQHGRAKRQGRESDLGLFPMDEIDWPGLVGGDGPPLAALGVAQEMAQLSRTAGELPVDGILNQLAEFGLPPELLEESRALGGEHRAELAGLLRAAAAMLAGDPVAGLLGVWEPLLDRKMGALDAELAAAEILWSFSGAIGEDDLVDGLSRLVEEAGPTGRPAALVMCRMLNHLGPPEIKSLAIRTANSLAVGGLEDRPWVSSLGTAAFRRAYRFCEMAERALVVEFAYGRRPHAFVLVVDEHGGGLIGLYVTEEVDELARQVYLDSLVQGNDLSEVNAAEAVEQLRAALDLPLCPENEDDEAEMESLVLVVQERLRRLAVAGPHPSAQRPPGDTDEPPPGVEIEDFGPHPRARAKVVHRVKVTLTGHRPAVWRRLEVSSDLSLPALHEVLQMAFDWTAAHPWLFAADGEIYGTDELDVPHRDAAVVTIGELAPGPGAAIEYRYDPDGGSMPRVRIRVENVGAGNPEAGYPRCLTGRRTGPADGTDADGPDEPHPFDTDELNGRLDRLVRRRR